MSRNIKRKQEPAHWSHSLDNFPKDKDGVLYVRQSSLAQIKNNVRSYEMQTDAFEQYFRDMGCIGDISTVVDDEKGKMSGTLDIHERPGLTKVVHLAETDTIGWVGVVHVNRLTRDPWLITPAVLMKIFHEHKVWIATLRMNFNFEDDYYQRVFMLEAEESARHLKWMKLVLGGGRLVASGSGYYDGRYITPGYIVDRSDPKHMHYIVYRPFAEVIVWLFRRFLELDGNFPLLCREVDAMPYLFPPFEPWVDPRNIGKFVMKQVTSGPFAGYYKPTSDGLRSMLTNPSYIGIWIPFEGDAIKDNHPALIPEDLFWYAFNRLATIDLNGERLKPAKTGRTTNAQALLMKVIKDDEGYPLYVELNHRDKYVYKKLNRVYSGREHGFGIYIETLDGIFVEKLLERIKQLETVCIDWTDTIEQAKINKEQRERNLKKSIAEAVRKMNHITALMSDPDTPLPKSMLSQYIEDYNGLEKRKNELEGQLSPEIEDEANEQQALYQINSLIPRIREGWNTLTFETRLLIVSGLVRRIVMTQPVTGWIRMEIQWKLPDWGGDVCLFHKTSSKSPWSTQEDEILQRLYPMGEVRQMLESLPMRSWKSILERAASLNIRRTISRKQAMTSVQASGIPIHISLEDWNYAQEHSLSFEGKNWSSTGIPLFAHRTTC